MSDTAKQAFEFLRLLQAEKDLKEELAQARAEGFFWLFRIGADDFPLGIGFPTVERIIEKTGAKLPMEPIEFCNNYLYPCLIALKRTLSSKGDDGLDATWPYVSFKHEVTTIILQGFEL